MKDVIAKITIMTLIAIINNIVIIITKITNIIIFNLIANIAIKTKIIRNHHIDYLIFRKLIFF
jgi:hypothetical protein